MLPELFFFVCFWGLNVKCFRKPSTENWFLVIFESPYQYCLIPRGNHLRHFLSEIFIWDFRLRFSSEIFVSDFRLRFSSRFLSKIFVYYFWLLFLSVIFVCYFRLLFSFVIFVCYFRLKLGWEDFSDMVN